jgi:hypothetical protein
MLAIMGKKIAPLSLVKRPEDKTSREDLLLRDVTQMFWELRELRQEATRLREENVDLIRENKKLKFENDLLILNKEFEA